MDNRLLYILGFLFIILLLIYKNANWFWLSPKFNQIGGQNVKINANNSKNRLRNINIQRVINNNTSNGETFVSELLADNDLYFQVKNHEIVYLQNLRKLRDDKLNTQETQKEKAQNLIKEHQDLIKLIPNAPIQPLYTDDDLTGRDETIDKIKQFYLSLTNDFSNFCQFNFRLLISILYLDETISDNIQSDYQQQKNNFELLSKQFNLL